MCGIIGYVGPRSSVDVLVQGLRRLEYRGYDSAGVAVVDAAGRMQVRKRAGRLDVLTGELESGPLPVTGTGIGHTRWATHGGPVDGNAHPHLGDEGRLALIHNGIIENYGELKAQLAADGHRFVSETDSEVAAVLLGREYRRTGELRAAMLATVRQLRGAFTLLAVHADQPGLVVGARRNSPLVIGLGSGENFLGSDVAAFVEFTRRALAIGQDQMVAITADSVEIVDFDGTPVDPAPFEVAWDASAADKGGWPSFMAKEIAEEPDAVANTLRGRLGTAGVALPELDGIDLAAVDRLQIVACGTAAYSALVGRYAIEEWAGIPVDVELAHEFRYRRPAIGPRTLVVSISQSGETMDTLMAVKYARERGATTLSICNTQGATIARESDAVLSTYAGPEVAVASTKAFVAQITALHLLGLALADARGSLDAPALAATVAELAAVPDRIAEVLEQHDRIRALAASLADIRSVLFLGRHTGYPIALEGALKLKELAYIHAEGFAAGELKHGPIALIEPGQRVLVVLPSLRHAPELHGKVLSNIQEIRARGAHVIAIAEEGDDLVATHADEVLRMPVATPLLQPLTAVVPLQLFAMELAEAKGLDVDKPRNLAKSVTVE